MSDAAETAEDLRRKVFEHHLADFLAAWDRFGTGAARDDRLWAWAQIAAAVAERDEGRA